MANVGAGHAARALSELTGGEKVGIDVPRAVKVDADRLVELLGGQNGRLCAVSVDMEGPLTGKLVLAWPEADALALARKLLKDGTATLESVHGESALQEAANIMVSACLSAVGDLVGWGLLPSIPTTHRGNAVELAREMMKDKVLRLDGTRWVLAARMFSQTVAGQLLLFPDAESVAPLLAQLHI
jgi:chemotaxis protein CheC